jgi:hypothetical protein
LKSGQSKAASQLSQNSRDEEPSFLVTAIYKLPRVIMALPIELLDKVEALVRQFDLSKFHEVDTAVSFLPAASKCNADLLLRERML